jgi:hypothetical protein
MGVPPRLLVGMTKDDARWLALRIACGILAVGGCGGEGSAARDQDAGAGGQRSFEAGAGGAAGSRQGCLVTRSAPLGGLIADFSPADGGGPDAGGSTGAIEIGGNVYVYGGPATPQSAFRGGSFEIVENASSTSATQYAGVGITFSNCIDASAFSGVSFSIGGSISGCAMYFTATISEDTYNDGTTDSDPRGVCTLGPSDCYSPKADLTGLTSASQTIRIAWPAFVYGMPDQTIDPAKITGVEWSFEIAAGPSGTCAADVTVDDVSFFE